MSELLKSGLVGNIRHNAKEGGLDPLSNQVNNEIVNAWSNTGLLVGISGSFKELVAKKLEEAAHILINYPDSYDNERTETLVFPVIRRILSGLKDFKYNTNFGYDMSGDDEWIYSTMERNQMLMEVLDVNMVINRVDLSIESSIEYAKAINGHIRIDAEAEAVAIVASELVEMHVRSHSGKVMKRTEDCVIVVESK